MNTNSIRILEDLINHGATFYLEHVDELRRYGWTDKVVLDILKKHAYWESRKNFIMLKEGLKFPKSTAADSPQVRYLMDDNVGKAISEYSVLDNEEEEEEPEVHYDYGVYDQGHQNANEEEEDKKTNKTKRTKRNNRTKRTKKAKKQKDGNNFFMLLFIT